MQNFYSRAEIIVALLSLVSRKNLNKIFICLLLLQGSELLLMRSYIGNCGSRNYSREYSKLEIGLLKEKRRSFGLPEEPEDVNVGEILDYERYNSSDL